MPICDAIPGEMSYIPLDMKYAFSRSPRTSSSTEIQIRLACAGRSADDVLTDLIRGLDDAKAQGRDPLVILEDLALLRDSVVTLIKGISRALADYPRDVTFWEASGLTEAFLSVMEAPPDEPR